MKAIESLAAILLLLLAANGLSMAGAFGTQTLPLPPVYLPFIHGGRPPVFCDGVLEIPHAECEALASIYQNHGGEHWVYHEDCHKYGCSARGEIWFTSQTPCAWEGIGCEDGHITTLNPQEMNLVGAFPMALFELPHLQRLDLRDNRLSGPIPSAIDRLINLRWLKLGDALSGPIPRTIGNLSRLEELHLSGDFSGQIPPELAQLESVSFSFEAKGDDATLCVPDVLLPWWLERQQVELPPGHVCDNIGINLGFTDREAIVWSPDGIQIAFIGGTSAGGFITRSDVYLFDVDRRTVRNLTEQWPSGANDHSPDWSADGSQIAFVVENDLVVMNVSNGTVTNLTQSAAREESLDWSADGSRIVFARDGGDKENEDSIFTVRPDGSNEVRLIGGYDEITHLQWSPDGKHIAFSYLISGVGDAGYGTTVMDADGGNPTEQNWDAYSLAWSPDSRRIAFVDSHTSGDGLHDLTVIDAGGSNQTLLIADVYDFDAPTWSPDGSRIVIGGRMINADGSNLVQLTDGRDPDIPFRVAGWDMRFAWSPTGKRIAFYRRVRVEYPQVNGLYVINAGGSGLRRIALMR